VLLRFQLQNILLYAAVFALTRMVFKPFQPEGAVAEPAPPDQDRPPNPAWLRGRA
jgi:hypothetical protein